MVWLAHGAQRLAVALAESKGLDPDNPRHLSRSVILPPKGEGWPEGRNERRDEDQDLSS